MPGPALCLFGTYGLSAHADRMQMVSLIEATSPRTVALVHGDEGAKQSLAGSLRSRDVLCARDGLVVQRSYPRRRRIDRRPSAPVPTAADLDIDRARSLLGPAASTPLRVAEIAEAVDCLVDALSCPVASVKQAAVKILLRLNAAFEGKTDGILKKRLLKAMAVFPENKYIEQVCKRLEITPTLQ